GHLRGFAVLEARTPAGAEGFDQAGVVRGDLATADLTGKPIAKPCELDAHTSPPGSDAPLEALVHAALARLVGGEEDPAGTAQLAELPVLPGDTHRGEDRKSVVM